MTNLLQKSLDKYQNMSVPVKAALWFTVCNFLQRGVSMITTPMFTRVLSTEEYGLYSTYLSWENVLLMVVSLCLYKALMNLYNKHDDKEAVLVSVIGLEILLSLVWLVIAVVFEKPIAALLGLSPVLVICMFVYFVFQSGIQCWSLYKRYVFDYRMLVAATLTMTIGSALAGVFAVLNISATAEARAVSHVAVVALVGICVYITVFKNKRRIYQKDVWKFSVTFCVVLMPHYLSEFVLQSSDKIMINYMCGTHDVAIYSVSYAAGSLINLITNAVNSTFAPYQYQKIKSGEYELLAKRANQVLGFVAVMLCGVMLFSREIVLFFGGHKYIESVSVIIPICVGVYFNYMFQLFARVQEYFERKVTVVLSSILCALLNLVLNYIFIKLVGYQAAAYTTFACYLIFCVIHYFFYRRACRELLDGVQLYNAKGLLIVSIVVIVAGAIIAIINQYLIVKYTLIIVLCFVTSLKKKEVATFLKKIMER